MHRAVPFLAVGLIAVLVPVGLHLGFAAAPAADNHPIPPPLEKPPPSAFECRWTDTPLTLDGTADEPAWKHAEVIDAFHQPWLGDKARMGRTQTTARLLWDREYLYFFAEMEDSDLFAQVKEHDGDIWTDDVFELFFHPDRKKTGYYEFQVNPLAAVFDAYWPKYPITDFPKQKKDGDFHVQAKVKLRGTLNKRDDQDKGWSVEGRIPWTDFVRTGGRPEPGEKWGMNLCRGDVNHNWKDQELSCVAPIVKRKISSFFHQTADYATLTFTGPNAHSQGKRFGIEKREPLTTSTVAGFPENLPPYKAVRTRPNFRIEYPIMVRAIPGSRDMLVINQPRAYGPTTLWRFTDSDRTTEKDLVKVMETPHRGTAYDIAFHPKFAENGYVYFGWNGPQQWWNPRRHSTITRYTMQPKPPYTLDAASAVTIVSWESNGHNGAAACFGNDGMLYVTSGDGTSDSDTNNVGQRIDLLYSKLMRLDVDHRAPGKMYSIPKDNPYVGDKRYAPETWAYGFRNPWRIACDSVTGHIWVGQNGQDLWEQAMLVHPKDNFGWSVTEGGHPFYPNRKAGPDPIVKPTVDHHHSEARSLTGGIVYHGKKLPGLQGAYLYGDYSTGRIWAVKHDGKKVLWQKEVAYTPMKITAFSTDADGELLICDHAAAGQGGFYTLELNPPPKVNTFPKKLSDSGLFDSVKDHRMKPGVIPYSVNASFWSDGMHKERFIALPAGETIGYTASRGWNFPDRTVLVKSFAVEQVEGDPASRKWIETRFFTKQEGEWYGYAYLWNDAGTDADLIGPGGVNKEFTIRTAKGDTRKQTWYYPSRAECMVCHSRAQNFVLGPTTVQMNKDHDYGNGRVENQLLAFERLGMFQFNWYAAVRGDISDKVNRPQPDQRQPKPSSLFPHNPVGSPRLVDPADKTQDLTARAKSWLHANCSSCHVEAGGGNALMELEFATGLEKMRVLDVKPLHQTLDLPDAKLVVPGHPERSVLFKRLSTRGPGQMPPLATSLVDPVGVEVIREWCRSLKK